LTEAVLAGVQSGGITGTPVALPANWQLVDAYLVGPDADLAGADEDGINPSNVDHSGASLTNAQFVGANLTEANLSSGNLTEASLQYSTATDANVASATWSNTTCPDGTNSGGDGGTCANDLACPIHLRWRRSELHLLRSAGSIDAAEAYAASIGTPASDVSDDWGCDAVPSLEAIGISDESGDAVGYLWVYDGVEKGWVIPASDCSEKVASWS
jgi:hypothetical protein